MPGARKHIKRWRVMCLLALASLAVTAPSSEAMSCFPSATETVTVEAYVGSAVSSWRAEHRVESRCSPHKTWCFERRFRPEPHSRENGAISIGSYRVAETLLRVERDWFGTDRYIPHWQTSKSVGWASGESWLSDDGWMVKKTDDAHWGERLEVVTPDGKVLQSIVSGSLVESPIYAGKTPLDKQDKMRHAWLLSSPDIEPISFQHDKLIIRLRADLNEQALCQTYREIIFDRQQAALLVDWNAAPIRTRCRLPEDWVRELPEPTREPLRIASWHAYSLYDSFPLRQARWPVQLPAGAPSIF